MPNGIAYLPLFPQLQTLSDAAIRGAVAYAGMLGLGLQVSAFSVDVPQLVSPLGDLLINIPDLVRASEQRSRAECARLLAVAQAAAEGTTVSCAAREALIGTAPDAAAAEARVYDLVVLPAPEGDAGRDLTQALVFGAGRPVILVPDSLRPQAPGHIAVAWDGSRVAARACADALALLPPGGRVSVLTVSDEKALDMSDPAATLAQALERRGIAAQPVRLSLGGRSIAETLQVAAVAQGAQLLAMGGFGHSRLRDFVLGGATRGVLREVALPTLLSH